MSYSPPKDVFSPTIGSNHPDDMEHISIDELPIIVLRDGLDMPLTGMDVQVDLPDGSSVTAKSDEQGIVTTPPTPRPKGKATLKVKGQDQQLHSVCTIDLDNCKSSVIVRSPKVAIPVSTEPHQQKSVTSTQQHAGGTWFEVNGALEKAWQWLKNIIHDTDKQPLASSETHLPKVKESLNKAGNPITVAVGPECPNPDNLWLGENNPYRAYIVAAAKRINIIPQALAALIDAEAARKKTNIPTLDSSGKPVISKKTGKPKVRVIKGGWDAESYNDKSRAAGLTQFLESTWLAHVLISGRFICEQSVVKKWVRQEPDSKGRQRNVFVLADGTTTTTPFKHKADPNVQACLEQRKNPEWSIMAAADYAKANLDVLKKSGFKLASLNDAEKAKLMYLMHHEGEGAGPLFIRNQMEKLGAGKYASFDERLKAVFVMQVGKSEAQKHIEFSKNNIQLAYRHWLAGYIDTNIKISKFACSQNSNTSALLVSKIFEQIGGSPI